LEAAEFVEDKWDAKVHHNYEVFARLLAVLVLGSLEAVGEPWAQEALERRDTDSLDTYSGVGWDGYHSPAEGWEQSAI